MFIDWFVRVSDFATAAEVSRRDRYWTGKLSRRLPSPNSLTFARVLGSILLIATVPKLSVVLIAAVPLALTDYFDGIIARTQGRETTLGKWLDPVADKLLVGAIIYTVYRSDQDFWLPLIIGMVIPELILGIIGLAFMAIRAPLTPRPCLWGRLKFTLYALATCLFLLGLSGSIVSLVIKGGVALAYISLLYYILRGYSERRIALVR